MFTQLESKLDFGKLGFDKGLFLAKIKQENFDRIQSDYYFLNLMLLNMVSFFQIR